MKCCPGCPLTLRTLMICDDPLGLNANSPPRVRAVIGLPVGPYTPVPFSGNNPYPQWVPTRMRTCRAVICAGSRAMDSASFPESLGALTLAKVSHFSARPMRNPVMSPATSRAMPCRLTLTPIDYFLGLASGSSPRGCSSGVSCPWACCSRREGLVSGFSSA